MKNETQKIQGFGPPGAAQDPCIFGVSETFRGVVAEDEGPEDPRLTAIHTAERL